ncbi:patatin family protein, partial [bacterium]|nr:patatin family protein [bacterium]
MNKPRVAIVLTGGGARGAYQAGAIRAIGEISKRHGITTPFDIYVGNSAGSINASWLVANAHQFEYATQRLCEFWNGLSTENIFKTDFKSLIGRGARWMWEVSTGGLYKKKVVRSLLDTTPLLRLILKEIDFNLAQQNVDSGLVSGLALTSVNYTSGDSQVFHYTNSIAKPWKKVRRESIETVLSAKHVMASSAIPILFPPVRIGTDYYGDGSLRNYTPMSPAVNLGAEKIMVIGVRAKDSTNAIPPQHPSLARILSVILNFVLLDAVDYDYESLSRINDILPESPDSQLKKIDVMMIRPQADLGVLATANVHCAPPLLRYLIRGLGTDSEAAD